MLPEISNAGELDPPAAPDDAASAMYTLEDFYNRLKNGTEGTSPSGDFTEPSAPPSQQTMHNVNDVMEQMPVADNTDGAAPEDVAEGKQFWSLRTDRSWGLSTGTSAATAKAPVPQTGQAISYAYRDDGNLKKGIAPPAPRFTDNNDGTVTDNLTGLIWLKNANYFRQKNWDSALTDCNALESGSCGLTDDSVIGDWRLPNLFELESLRNMAYANPCISNAAGNASWIEGDPFINVQSNCYWSGTTYANIAFSTWTVNMDTGNVNHLDKNNSYYVWPVRGGQ